MLKRIAPAALGALALLPAATQADTPLPTTATFSVSAQVVAGCGIVGTSQTSGLNFGTLNFGTHPAVATGRASASALVGGTALQLECSPNTVVGVTVGGGTHASAGNAQRNLQLAGGSLLIPYALYSDAALTQALAVDQPFSLTVSGTINMPIYGTLDLPGPATSAGMYTDTVQVTLSY